MRINRERRMRTATAPPSFFWYGSRTTDRGSGWVWEREQRSKGGREMEQAERELDALILEVTMDAVMFVRGCLTIFGLRMSQYDYNPSF